MSRRHFGSVRKLPSGRYQASYWHQADRHIAPQTFTTKADAQTWLSNVETTIHAGSWVDPTAGRITVAQLTDRWKERDPSKRLSTIDRDEAILRLHIVPTLGDRAVHEVTPVDVQRLVNEWAADQAPRTVIRQYAVLRAVFAYAVRSRWLARTPCESIKLPRPAASRRRSPSPEQVAAIVASTPDSLQAMVWVGAVLGLRWGEAAGLTVGSLDLLNATLSVSQQLTRQGQLAVPKSMAGVRRLTIPGPLVEILADHLAQVGLTAADRTELVFRTATGEPLHYSNWRQRVWVPAVKAAGLEDVSFHDLRRASASEMVALGVDVKTAQHRLGHSSVRMTLDVYARALPTADRQAAERLGEKFFPAARPGVPENVLDGGFC